MVVRQQLRLLLVVVVGAAVVQCILQRVYTRTDRGKIYILTALDGGNWSRWSCPYGFGVRHFVGSANEQDANVLFAVGPDQRVYQMHEDPTSLRWHEWQSLPGLANVSKLVSSRDVVGSWRVYAITDANKMLVTSPEASAWWGFDGDVLDAVATADADGNHQVFSIMADGAVSQSTEVHGVWSAWGPLNPAQVSNDPALGSLSVATSRLGYRCLCGISVTGGGVWARLETPNGWLPWQYLGGEAVQVQAARWGVESSFVIVILGSNKYLHVAMQDGEEGSFTSWTAIATEVQTFELSSMGRPDYVNSLHFLDLQGSLWTMHQSSNNQWTSATSMAPSARLRQLTGSPSPLTQPLDGRSCAYGNPAVVQELFGLAHNATAYRRVQNILGTWSGWEMYTSNVSQLVSGPKSGQVYIRDLNGTVYRMVETGSGKFVRRVAVGSAKVAKIKQCYMPYSMTSQVFGLEDGTGRLVEPMASSAASPRWPQWTYLPAAPTPCLDFSVAPNIFSGFSVFCLTTTGVVYELTKDESANVWSANGWTALPHEFVGAPDVEAVPPLVQVEAIQGTQVGLIGRDASNKLWALLQRLDGTWSDSWYPNMLSGSSAQITVNVDWQGYIAVYFTSADGMSFQEQRQSSSESFDAGTQLPIPIEAFATTSDMSGLNHLFLTQSSGKTSGFVKSVGGTWDPLVSFDDVNHFTTLVATTSTRLPGSQEAYVLLQNRTVLHVVRDFYGTWEPSWRFLVANIKQFLPGTSVDDALAVDMQGMVYSIKGSGAVRQPLGIANMEKILVSQALLLGIDATSHALKEWAVGGDGSFNFEWTAVPGAVACLDVAATPDATGVAVVFCIDASTKRLKYSTKSYDVGGSWSGSWTAIGESSSQLWQSVATAMMSSGSLVVFAQDVDQGYVFMLQQNGPSGSWPATWTLLLPTRVSSFTPVSSPSGGISVLALSSSTSALMSVNLDLEDSAMVLPASPTGAFTVAKGPTQQPQLYSVNFSTGQVSVSQPLVVGSLGVALPSLGTGVMAVYATDQAAVELPPATN